MALSDEDLKNIKQIVEVTIEEKTESVLATKADISHLPTKNEFFGKMDEVMGELKAIREEQTVQSHQLSGHADRITKLEDKTGITPA